MFSGSRDSVKRPSTASASWPRTWLDLAKRAQRRTLSSSKIPLVSAICHFPQLYSYDSDGIVLLTASPPPDPPWAPGKPAVRDIGKTSALLAWTRPEHDGGAKIEGYIIEFQKSGSEEWICIADNVPLTEHQLQGLKEKQEYSFRVKAVNKAGESDASEPSDPVVCKERLCKLQDSCP